ncbi:hypothetical protein GP486_003281, partial [Trichoglossum hirsutum]
HPPHEIRVADEVPPHGDGVYGIISLSAHPRVLCALLPPETSAQQRDTGTLQGPSEGSQGDLGGDGSGIRDAATERSARVLGSAGEKRVVRIRGGLEDLDEGQRREEPELREEVGECDDRVAVLRALVGAEG